MTACATEKIIPKPEIVHVPGPVERVEVPAEHLIQEAPVTIPEGDVTFGETNALWAVDRASLKTVNGRLLAIESLSDPE